ncbi:MAG: (2Fe-2S)-binding protein [Polyangiaceae bacterium]
MYVCLCHAVTDQEIRDAIRDGNTTAQAIMNATRAGTGCGSCVDEIVEMAARGQFTARACHRINDGKRHLTVEYGQASSEEAPPASAA